MLKSVFVETTIPSYYTGRPSSNLILAANQLQTQEWWDNHRHDFELFSSPMVLIEASKGNPNFAARRENLLKDVPLLPITDEITAAAKEIVCLNIIPEKASDDAYHIACSAYHGIDFLLTWNCTHIANPYNKPRVRECLTRHGMKIPVICTPHELIHGTP